MFPPKKKSGLDIAIAVGKPKPKGSDLGSPSPIDKPPKPPMAAGDSPDETGSEDYSAKLIADIEAAGESVGLDPVTSREAAGKFFAAAAKCLMQDSGEPEAADVNESDTENYSA